MIYFSTQIIMLKLNRISSIGSSGPQQKKDLFQFKRELSNEHS